MEHRGLKKQRLLLLLLCVLQVLLAWSYGVKKEGYFIDEIWSYGLANSTRCPQVYSIPGWDEDWLPKDYLKDYIEVAPGEGFHYGSVVYNQTKDNHPPLFYLVLHTVCSFFPGSFSKWYGIVPNLLYFIVVDLLLYVLAEKLFGDWRFSLLVMSAWGFSVGAVSCAIYIRMYMLMALWLMALLCLYERILEGNPAPRHVYAAVGLVTFLGYMTHYYFYLAVFFAGGAVGLLLAFQKRWKDYQGFWAANLGALAGVLLCFPASFLKILGLDDDRGVQAYETFQKHQELPRKFREMAAILGQQELGNLLKEILVASALLLAFCLLWRRERLFFEAVHTRCIFLVVAAVLAAGYLGIVSATAPYQVDRYLFCLYPAIVLLVFGILWELLSIAGLPARAGRALLLLAACFMLWGEYRVAPVNYLYLGEQENLKQAEKYGGLDCIYISRYDEQIIADIPELLHYRKVRRIHEKEIPRLYRLMDPGTEELIVYVDKESFERIEEMEKELISGSRLNWWEILFETDKCQVYRLFL